MPLLRRWLAPAAPAAARSLENPAVALTDADAWNDAFGPGAQSEAGEQVNGPAALSTSSFLAAVKLISGDVSRLPLATFRTRTPAGDQLNEPQLDRSHYLTGLLDPLTGQANAELNACKLWRRTMVQALVYSNAYLVPLWNGRKVAELLPLLSDRTGVIRTRGRLYVITEIGSRGQLKAWPYSECLHIEGCNLEGLAAEPTIKTAREDIGIALAARGYKARFFGQNLQPGGILQCPPGTTPKARAKVEAAVEELHTSRRRSFKTVILHDGYVWHSTQMDAAKAQLSEIEETGVRNDARRFLLSPSRLGVRDSVSYNSLAEDRKDYHDTALGYWLSAIAAEANQKLLTKQERAAGWQLAHRANLALLFADASTLANIGAVLTNAKDERGRPILRRNEIRGWLNLPPLDENEPPPPAPPPAPAAMPRDRRAERAAAAQAAAETGRAAIAALWLAHEAARLLRRYDRAAWPKGRNDEVAAEALAGAAAAANIDARAAAAAIAEHHAARRQAGEAETGSCPPELPPAGR